MFGGNRPGRPLHHKERSSKAPNITQRVAWGGAFDFKGKQRSEEKAKGNEEKQEWMMEVFFLVYATSTGPDVTDDLRTDAAVLV